MCDTSRCQVVRIGLTVLTMRDETVVIISRLIIASVVLLAVLVVWHPYVPLWDDDTETVTYYVKGDTFDVDVRMGDLDGYTGGLVRMYSALLLSSMYVTPYDPTVSKVWAELEPRMDGMTDSEKADFLLDFVQWNVHYAYDDVWYGVRDYVQVPAETLYLKRGDCEDSAYLLYTLYARAGLDAVIVTTTDHVSLAVKVPCVYQNYVTFRGERYYTAEPTTYYDVGMTVVDDGYRMFNPEFPFVGIFIVCLGDSALLFISYIASSPDTSGNRRRGKGVAE